MDVKEVLAMLAELFHIIPKEVLNINNPDLLPGELGIHYPTATMFFCNPNTGEIISPNKGDALMQYIVAKYNYNTKEFNSDLWQGMHLYKSLSELNMNPGTESIEALFSVMKIPSMLVCSISNGNCNGLLPNDRGGILTVTRLQDDMILEFADRMNFQYSAYYDNTATPKLKTWTSSGGGAGGGGYILNATGNTNYTASSVEITAYFENMTIEVMFTSTNTSDNPALNINSFGSIALGELNSSGNFVPFDRATIVPHRFMRFRLMSGNFIFLDMPLTFEEYTDALNPVHYGPDFPENENSLWFAYDGE